MQLEIAGQVALVTGSAHRVGKAIALELARQGANIVVHYHRTDEAIVRDTVQDMKSHGVDALPVQANLSTRDGVTALFSTIVEHFKRLDILVNSASIFQQRRLLDVTLEEWERTLAVNVTAPFLCTQAAAELMAKNVPPGGAIVNILDRGAVMPWENYAHHGVSKAALAMLTQTSAVTLAPTIRVNAVIPGPVMQPDNVTDPEWAATGQKNLLKRTGTAEDVARAVAFLLTENFITGTTLHVNGGRHLAG
jgi:NAD(P)-dependent dehydrogenase (short-subunit alcohol dehydrogenase family)